MPVSRAIRLLAAWLVVGGLTLFIIVIQMITNKYDDHYLSPLVWFFLTHVPIIAAIVAYDYLAGAKAKLPPASPKIALTILILYLSFALLTVLVEPATSRPPLEIFSQSYYWLIPFQLLATIAIVIVSFRQFATVEASEGAGLVSRIRLLESALAARDSVAGATNLNTEAGRPFDVFLAHSSLDKPFVKGVAESLKQRGLKPWLDEEQIAPGAFFQDVIEGAISKVRTAAVFIGRTGIGRIQRMEIRVLLSACADNEVRVIPVLLPGAEFPAQLRFLKELSWTKFENDHDSTALDRLEWGITGRRSEW